MFLILAESKRDKIMSKNSLTLAITTIGDLLGAGKITQDQEGKPIEEVGLKIPDYQRPYKWKAENANQLLDDILGAQTDNKEVYRVGTLILHKTTCEEQEVYHIVDGQQRVITFSLLLKAFGCDVKFLQEEIPANSLYVQNILNNYALFCRRVAKYSSEEKNRLLTYIQSNCELIVVITEDITEAFQFFDSQNARGKKLYPHDLLKAYHLREMRSVNADETEKLVKTWEDMNQRELSSLFKDYLYRIKAWIKGNRADELDEKNIIMFKGLNREDNYPYAQFYKGAFSYADHINHSSIPFVTGSHSLSAFQLDTPIIAGKPFFDYAKHYFDVLSDIRNNDKYEGCFINDNPIIETLNQRKYKNGVGNRITRLLLDTSILLYVDRFCPERPSAADLELLDQFVVFAFIWAYSLRAQYTNLGWLSAQNYIMGNPEMVNSFNIFKVITEADSPNSLLSTLSDKILPLSWEQIAKEKDFKEELIEKKEGKTYVFYLYYFRKYQFLSGNV